MKFNLMMATALGVCALGFAGCGQSSADETAGPETETTVPVTTGQTSKDSAVSETSNAAAVSYELRVTGMT